jgi:hypothetical protein
MRDNDDGKFFGFSAIEAVRPIRYAIEGLLYRNTRDGKPNDIVKRSGADANHFAPDYFKSGSYRQVPDLEFSESAYSKAREAFRRDGRSVFDATIGGKLTVFPKIDLEEAIDLCRVQ